MNLMCFKITFLIKRDPQGCPETSWHPKSTFVMLLNNEIIRKNRFVVRRSRCGPESWRMRAVFLAQPLWAIILAHAGQILGASCAQHFSNNKIKMNLICFKITFLIKRDPQGCPETSWHPKSTFVMLFNNEFIRKSKKKTIFF